MEQQIVEAPVLELVQSPRDGQPSDVLLRLWTEAEQVVVTSARAEPNTRQAVRQERARVRYAYD